MRWFLSRLPTERMRFGYLRAVGHPPWEERTDQSLAVNALSKRTAFEVRTKKRRLGSGPASAALRISPGRCR
jgi:hypothetical protein